MSFNWNRRSFNENYGFNMDRVRPVENRFYAIYFVDSITGALLISRKYSDKSFGFSDKNEDLISGFLNAINMFINEIKVNKDEEIQEINFRDTRILYEKRGRLLCIGISKKTELIIERNIIHTLLKDFYNRFEYEINNFKGLIDEKMLNYQLKLRNQEIKPIFNLNSHL